MFDVSCPALDHHRVRFLIPLLTLLLCGCPKLWGPCPGGVLNTLSLTDGEMVMGDETGSDVNWGDVEKLNLEKCTEVRGSIFLSGHVRGLQKFSNIRNIAGTIWFFDVRVDPPGLVEIFPALETLGGINATEARSSMEVFSGFRALIKTGNLELMGLRPQRVDAFNKLVEAGDIRLGASSTPSFSALRRVGNLVLRGRSVEFGVLPQLEVAGVVDIEGLASEEILFPRLTSAVAIQAVATQAVSLHAPLVGELQFLILGSNARLREVRMERLAHVNGMFLFGGSAATSLAGLAQLRLIRGDLHIVGNHQLAQDEIDRFLQQLTIEGATDVCENGAGDLCF